MKKTTHYIVTIISFLNVYLFYSIKPLWFNINQMINDNSIWVKLAFALVIISFLINIFWVVKSETIKIKHLLMGIPVLVFLGFEIYTINLLDTYQDISVMIFSPLFLVFLIAALLILAFMTLLIKQPNLSPVRITSGPNFSYSGNELVVMWTTNVKSTGIVEVGSKNNIRNVSSSVNGLLASDTTHFKVVLPDVKDGDVIRVVSRKIKAHYQTRIVFGNTVYSDFVKYKDTRNKPVFSFYVLSDMHGRKEIYDKYLSNNDHDFVVFNGDVCCCLDTEKQITSEFLAPITNYSFKPFYFVRGNHETRGAYSAAFTDYIALDDNKYYYTFTYGNTFFIVLDTGEDKRDDHIEYSGLAGFEAYREEQTAWLESVVAGKEYKDYEHIIAVSHIPLIKDEMFPYKEKWMSLLNEIPADVLICGHTHKTNMIQTESIPIVIGGGYVNPNSGYEAIKVTAGETILFETITEEGEVKELYKTD